VTPRTIFDTKGGCKIKIMRNRWAKHSAHVLNLLSDAPSVTGITMLS
jgi:hypothetical protein